MQVPHESGPARDLDVICLDMASGEVVEVSSSYDLSIFSPKIDAQFSKGGGDAPDRSSSMSIGELWAEMDILDAISHGDTSTGNVPRNVLREWRSLPSVKTTGERTSHMDKGALLDDTPGPSNAQPRGHKRGRGRYSAKNKAM
jgi:hypothetical protein